MRRLSLNARTAHDAAATDEVEVVLMRISHPDLETPVRLSTDPTERISVEPLVYGTRSTWAGGAVDTPYLFVIASAVLPDDQEDAPPVATIALEVVDRDMAAVLRSTTTRATVDVATVLASSPDEVESEWWGLELIGVDGDAGEIRLQVGREPLDQEPWPARRMTREAFPGLHP